VADGAAGTTSDGLASFMMMDMVVAEMLEQWFIRLFAGKGDEENDDDDGD
jgi:hypothetical protein